MKLKDPHSYEDTIIALEAVMKLLEKRRSKNPNAGACLWKAPGARIIVRLTPADAKLIPGAVFIGGPCDRVTDEGSLYQ
jgi:hypothetical protein